MAVTNIIERTVDIDVGVVQEDLHRLFAVADAWAHMFKITVMSKGQAQSLSGHTVVGYFMTNYYGTVVINGTISDNVVTLTLPAACYANNTGFQLIIRLVNGSTKTAIYWGSGYVSRSATSPIIDPGTVVPDLDDLLARLDQMDQATQAANTAADNANVAASKSIRYDTAQSLTDAQKAQAQSNIGFLTDNTLTVQGAAADAKKTGDEITALKGDLYKVTSSLRFFGKKISIIGDSIDTFDASGYKIDGYNMYYPRMDVLNVEQTWWFKVIKLSGAELEVNASFSGSRVTNSAASSGYPDLYDRVELIGSPDVVFITLGTNDYTSNVDLGDYDFTSAYTELSENTFRTAYIKGIKALISLYPSTEIVCITEKIGSEYKESIQYIAKVLGVSYIDAGNYFGESGVHPGAYGMTQIANMVLYPTKSKLDNIIKNDVNSIDLKFALLSCLEHVAWSDSHGLDYYNLLKQCMDIKIAPNFVIGALISTNGQIGYNPYLTRAAFNPLAYNLKPGNYDIVVSYSGEYYFSILLFNYDQSLHNDVDFEIIQGSAVTILPEDSCSPYWNYSSWSKVSKSITVTTEHPFIAIQFKKGTAGTDSFTQSDIDILQNHFNIEYKG